MKKSLSKALQLFFVTLYCVVIHRIFPKHVAFVISKVVFKHFDIQQPFHRFMLWNEMLKYYRDHPFYNGNLYECKYEIAIKFNTISIPALHTLVTIEFEPGPWPTNFGFDKSSRIILLHELKQKAESLI